MTKKPKSRAGEAALKAKKAALEKRAKKASPGPASVADAKEARLDQQPDSGSSALVTVSWFARVFRNLTTDQEVQSFVEFCSGKNIVLELPRRQAELAVAYLERAGKEHHAVMSSTRRRSAEKNWDEPCT